MRTGDGLLVRFSPVGGALPPEAFVGLADAARAFGNGVVEVTARGALQFRGLREDTVEPFRRALCRLGIAAEPHPTIVSSPLAGLDSAAVADPRPVACDLASRCSGLHLGPKVTVLVDGGGGLHLDDIGADVRLLAVPASGGVLWHISVGGDAGSARNFGALATTDAAEGARSVLSLLASHGSEKRARDLSDESIRQALGCLATRSPAPGPRPPADAVGLRVLGSGSVLGVAGAFGQVDAGALASFAYHAARNGSPDIRTAPGRVLLATRLDAAAAIALRDAAIHEDFITDPSDVRRRLVACPGRPACGSGEIASRALASELVASAADLLDGSVLLHVSGCSKGCAHPGPAAITLVGADGLVDVLLAGGTRDIPLARLPRGALPAALRRLGEALEPLRREGRTTASALALTSREALLPLLLEGAD